MRSGITPKNDFQNNNQPIKSNPSNQLSTIQFILNLSAIIFDASCHTEFEVFGIHFLVLSPQKVFIAVTKKYMSYFSWMQPWQL